MIPLAALFVTGITAFVVPRKAVLFSLLFVSIWLEWIFPQMLGARIGILDVLVPATFFAMACEPHLYERPRTNGIGPLVLGYVAISIVAAWLNPYSPESGFAKKVWELYKAAYISLLFFVFVVIVDDRPTLKQAVLLFLVSSVVSAAFGILQGALQMHITIATGTYGDAFDKGALFIMNGRKLRAFGTLWAANNFGGYLLAPLAIAFAILVMDPTNPHRKKLLAAAAIMLGGLLFSFARGSWMGFAVSAALIVWLTGLYQNRRFVAVMAIFFVAAIALGSLSGLDFFGRLTSVKNFKNDTAMLPRFIRWQYFFGRSLERPLFGFGTVADPVSLRFLNYDAVSTHNTFLSVAVRRGYIAVAIMAAIIGKTLSMSHAVFRRGIDPFERAIGLGVFSSFLGLFVVSGFFDAFLEETQLNVVFWLLIAVTVRFYNRLPISESEAMRGLP